MDVRALSPIMGGQSAAVAASSAPAAVTPVAAPSPAELNQEQLTEARVSMPGIYLRKQDSEGIPRWVVMTALRAYGLNIENEGAPRPSPVREAAQAAQAAAQVDAQAAPVAAPVQPSVAEKVAQMAKPVQTHTPVKVVKA